MAGIDKLHAKYGKVMHDMLDQIMVATLEVMSENPDVHYDDVVTEIGQLVKALEYSFADAVKIMAKQRSQRKEPNNFNQD